MYVLLNNQMSSEYYKDLNGRQHIEHIYEPNGWWNDK